ncbi:NrfD/PsrC family molybdoenzyme membrane anchor subunit [Anaeromyxobacter diazotrophicus]|uniref:Oxidoreductase n=1 Tax=Anaeromyxobacter diazotrophicus TaxID=2590199 RepID=A0A7I9VKD4_9BACT|nr:NrfD/PsrC family molybdoenzyme membrane anchor subunit [Anaeromyxobacter diazotrophicus]GEJ56853.1 oxidoreductase [Anaeromyxobacter diazotrophicus]
MPEISGFSFPNDVHVWWSLMIVMYPYITGFVAGAFIVTSLYHLFGRTEFKPVARLAMATSFAFLLVASLPLQLHLGHPERGVQVMVTPHFTSAMAGFGILYSGYLAILVLEVWFVWRPEIILRARRSRGLRRAFYAALALGTYDTGPQALEVDHRAITLLAGLGLPGACMLHGYVGFIFGAIKANPWWSTPLMPVIFLVSAAVSGIALLVVLYQVVSRLQGRSPDQPCVSALARWLWFFLILTLTLELLEIIVMAYERSESWLIISELLTTRLQFSYVTMQMIVGGLIPLILLAVVVLMNRYLHERVRNTLSTVAALLCLLQVFSMRWNIVVGGQLMSKSLRGLRSPYEPELFGREGVLMAIALVAAPFVILWVFDRVLGIEEREPEAGSGSGAPEERRPAAAAGGGVHAA